MYSNNAINQQRQIGETNSMPEECFEKAAMDYQLPVFSEEMLIGKSKSSASKNSKCQHNDLHVN